MVLFVSQNFIEWLEYHKSAPATVVIAESLVHIEGYIET